MYVCVYATQNSWNLGGYEGMKYMPPYSDI